MVLCCAVLCRGIPATGYSAHRAACGDLLDEQACSAHTQQVAYQRNTQHTAYRKASRSHSTGSNGSSTSPSSSKWLGCT